MNPEHCLIEREGHVLIVTLNRPEAKKIAAGICDNGPLSIRALMRMLREVDESHSEADALAKELEYGSPVFGTRDAREGMKAFAEKRKPVYTGE